MLSITHPILGIRSGQDYWVCMQRLKRYSIVDLAESLKLVGGIWRGKHERWLSGMQFEMLVKTHGRAGAAVPTVQLY